MKKFKKISYILLIIIIAILTIIIYGTISTGNNKNEKSKALAEIEFLEMKLETMLNQMNNIETRNYDVSISEISKQKQSEKTGEDSGAESSESNSGTSNESSGQGRSKRAEILVKEMIRRRKRVIILEILKVQKQAKNLN